MLRLVDAPRCPYCARVRIMLAEKGIQHDAVVIDLADRPPGSTSSTRRAGCPSWKRMVGRSRSRS